MTVFPVGIDPAIGSSAGATLDAANHTNLHNTLSSGMNAVQLLLGVAPTGGTEAAGSIRQRLLNAETSITNHLPIASVLVTPRAPGQAPTVSWSGEPNRILTLGIPSGLPGTNGTNGKDGVGAAASGIATAATLTPIKASAIVGLDVSFGKDLGFVPKVLCTPIQDTVGTSGGVTSNLTVSSKAPSGVPPTSTTYATYQGDGAKRTGTEAQAGTIWHGQYSTNNGHQHGMVVLGDLTSYLKDATITKVELTIRTAATSIEPETADQITVHQSNLTTVPTQQQNSVTSGQPYYRYVKALAASTTFTFALPTSWHAGFKSGAIASLIFGPERLADGSLTTSALHYGAIHAQDTVVTVYYSVTSATTTTKTDSIPCDVGVRDVTSLGFRLIVRNSSPRDEKVRVSWMASA